MSGPRPFGSPDWKLLGKQVAAQGAKPASTTIAWLTKVIEAHNSDDTASHRVPLRVEFRDDVRAVLDPVLPSYIVTKVFKARLEPAAARELRTAIERERAARTTS